MPTTRNADYVTLPYAGIKEVRKIYSKKINLKTEITYLAKKLVSKFQHHLCSKITTDEQNGHAK